jgi:hypothetical protein
MARFYLMEAHVYGQVRLKAGTTIADTAGNAIAGDKVVTTLSAATVTPGMKPLDAAATSMKGSSAYANTPVSATIPGNMSIDA